MYPFIHPDRRKRLENPNQNDKHSPHINQRAKNLALLLGELMKKTLCPKLEVLFQSITFLIYFRYPSDRTGFEKTVFDRNKINCKDSGGFIMP